MSLLHSLIPIFLSSVPDYMTSIFFRSTKLSASCSSSIYVCGLDVALFHSWLQGVTSKSVRKFENSLVVVSLDIVDREILDLEGGKELQRG